MYSNLTSYSVCQNGITYVRWLFCLLHSAPCIWRERLKQTGNLHWPWEAGDPVQQDHLVFQQNNWVCESWVIKYGAGESRNGVFLIPWKSLFYHLWTRKKWTSRQVKFDPGCCKNDPIHKEKECPWRAFLRSTLLLFILHSISRGY